jgi:N-acetylmuramoyl-L-alanine amidase
MSENPSSASQSPSTPGRTPDPKFNLVNSLQTIGSVAVIIATLFTLWTPANLFSGQLLDSMLAVMEATSMPVDENPTPVEAAQGTLPRIGIVAGHWKDTTRNPGFICSEDGFAEERLNLRIATMVRQELAGQGFQVDLLPEFDPSLFEYQALALISIHNDTCDYIGEDGTGFKVAPALGNSYPDQVNRLVTCMIEQYQTDTGLRYQMNQLTVDMTTYHDFKEVHSSTPVIIIETGYMNLDRQILTENTDKIVKGIVDGILCYVNGEVSPLETATVTP